MIGRSQWAAPDILVVNHLCYCSVLCPVLFFHEPLQSSRGTLRYLLIQQHSVLLPENYLPPASFHCFLMNLSNLRIVSIFQRVPVSGLHFSHSFSTRYGSLGPLLLLPIPLQWKQWDMKASVIFFSRKRPFCINLLKVLIKTKQI